MSPEGVRPFHSRFAAPWPPARRSIHPRSAAGRALQLAQGIQARSIGLVERMRRLPMTLLSRPAAAPAGTVRLEVNVALGEGTPARPNSTPPAVLVGTHGIPAALPPAPSRPVDRPLMELAHPSLPAPASQTGLAAVLQRLVQRYERIETAVRFMAPGPADLNLPLARLIPAPNPDLQPAPDRQVVSRAAPVAEASGSGPAAPARAKSESPAEPALPATPPLDINRLTDQVIQAIDRRVIASRERRGRI